jgi:hypothetical protein
MRFHAERNDIISFSSGKELTLITGGNPCHKKDKKLNLMEKPLTLVEFQSI